MRFARNNDGFVLVSAVILLTVILGLGLGLLYLTDNQQKASAREQASESAFNVAEAALNAQVGQLSRLWPSVKKEPELYPSAGCTESTSTATNGCPTPASLNAAYASSSPLTCPAGATRDAWGSPLTNRWTTYVRDDGTGSSYFNSPAEQSEPSYDANKDNRLWVRSVGVVDCRLVTVVTLVARQEIPFNFPKDAASANWFEVTNSGNKAIVNTLGEWYEYGAIGMRCEGVSAGKCEVWNEAKEQISPNTTKSPPPPSPIMTEAQLASMKAQAEAAGTFHSGATGTCPKSPSELSGLPAYVEGCGELHLTNGEANSSASPGFLILADGTIDLESTQFHGVIYAHNPSNYTGVVVHLGGSTTVWGAIDVDGGGGIYFGSSKANLIYNPKAIVELKAYGGTTPTRNTFRVLPANQ